MDEKRALDRLVNDFKTIEQALLSVKRGHDTNEGNWVNQLERYRIAISKVDAAARRIQTSGGGALAALRQNAAVPTGKPHLPDVDTLLGTALPDEAKHPVREALDEPPLSDHEVRVWNASMQAAARRCREVLRDKEEGEEEEEEG